MENIVINLSVVAEVAKALKNYRDKMVFVGGAVVSLYTDDAAAGEIRPTGDIDLTLNIINLSNWVIVQEELSKLGFHPDPFGHAICSYKYKDIPVDIMSTEDGPLGPSNRWYKIGFTDLWKVKVKTEEINILKAPYYLATKFEAFNNRGTDYRTSHDMEDVIYILDNRIDIVDEINKSPLVVKSFIQYEIQRMIDDNILEEVLEAHIHPLVIEQRYPLIIDKITQIIS